MQPPIKRPWYMLYPLAGVIVLSLLWCGFWYVAFTKAREMVADRREHLASQGTTLACMQETWGGFPFRFEFECDGAKLTTGAFTITSQRLRALVQAYNPYHILVLINGPTHALRGDTELFNANHDDALISVTYTSGGRWDLSSDVAHVAVTNLFDATSLRLFARNASGPLEIAGNLEQGHLMLALPITALDFKGDVLNPETVRLARFSITSEAVTLAGEGEIGLDLLHRLVGRLSLETNDVDGLLALLAPQFHLTDQDRATVKSAITLQNPNPAAPIKKADVSARDGGIYWGPIRFAESPPLY